MAPWRLPSAALAVAIPLVTAAVVGTAGEPPRAQKAPTVAQANRALAATPTPFEPSGRGYRARGAGYDLFLDAGGTTLVLQRGVKRRPITLQSNLIGARKVKPTSESRLPGVVNIYRGSTEREGIPTYGRVRYGSVYRGIDAVYHGRQGALEYDFEVQPGANPGRIAIGHAGARSISVDRSTGDLVLRVRGGLVRERRPIAYQMVDGRRVRVEASYRIEGDRVRFELGSYDRARKLVIDPVLSYSSYLGGSNLDYLMSVAVGSDKSVYVAGRTTSNDFPGGSRDNARTDVDAFVTKLKPDGSRVYTSYVGSSGLDQASDVAVDSSGRAYLVGSTDSNTFAPFASLGSEDCTEYQFDAFIVRLDAAGALNYRSCFGGGGQDYANGLALREPAGDSPEAYVVGTTSSAAQFPTSSGGYQTTCCSGGAGAFLVKIKFGSPPSIPYGTFLESAGAEYGRAIAIDSAGNAYVAGDASSSTTSIGGVTKPPSSAEGVFVTKLNPAASGSASLVYSTWLDGSSADLVGSPYAGGEFSSTTATNGGIAVNSKGIAYVVGGTASSNLPAAVASSTFKYVSGDAGYIGVIGANGSVARTIYVDGSAATHLSDIALQEIGEVTSIYAIGDTSGTIDGLNTLSGQSCAGNSDALLVKIADGAPPTGIYLTCLGGTGDDYGTSIAAGPGADASSWILGTTTGSFPTVNPKQADPNAVTDGFIAKLGQKAPSIDSGPPDGTVIATGSVAFTFSTDQPALTFLCGVPDGGRLSAGKPLGPCSGAGSAEYSGLANGEHTFEVATVDAGGAQSISTRKFTVNSSPPNAAYSIAPNPVLVGRPAAFDASASTPVSGTIVRYEWDLDGDGSFETDSGSDPRATRTYDAVATVNTSLRVTDSNGAVGVAGAALRVTDPFNVGQQIGVSINKGAQYTNKPDVTLAIVPPTGATALLIANDGGFAGVVPQAVGATVKWRLDSSGPERLPKTVYVRFLTGTFASPNFTDDIILDERPPVVSSASIAGPPASSSAVASASRLKRFKVKVKARDSNSGVGKVQVAITKRKPGKLISYKRTVKVKLAKRPKFLRARDRAGNYSKWKKLR